MCQASERGEGGRERGSEGGGREGRGGREEGGLANKAAKDLMSRACGQTGFGA